MMLTRGVLSTFLFLSALVCSQASSCDEFGKKIVLEKVLKAGRTGIAILLQGDVVMKVMKEAPTSVMEFKAFKQLSALSPTYKFFLPLTPPEGVEGQFVCPCSKIPVDWIEAMKVKSKESEGEFDTEGNCAFEIMQKFAGDMDDSRAWPLAKRKSLALQHVFALYVAQQKGEVCQNDLLPRNFAWTTDSDKSYGKICMTLGSTTRCVDGSVGTGKLFDFDKVKFPTKYPTPKICNAGVGLSTSVLKPTSPPLCADCGYFPYIFHEDWDNLKTLQPFATILGGTFSATSTTLTWKDVFESSYFDDVPATLTGAESVSYTPGSFLETAFRLRFRK